MSITTTCCSALLFSIGAVGVLVRRNAIVVFMCVELMLNAVNLSLVTFARINVRSTASDGLLRHGRRRGRGRRGLAIIMSIFRTAHRVDRRRQPAQVLGELRAPLPQRWRTDMTELPEVLPATGTAGLAWLLFVLPLWAPSCCCSPGGARTAGATGSGRHRRRAFVVAADLLRHPRAGPRPAHPRAVAVPLVRRRRPGRRLRAAARPTVADVRAAHHRVGALIHLYSSGTWVTTGPAAVLRQLNLFVTAMLLLVLGTLRDAYLGWEGVGSPHTADRFYQERPSAATAAKKAF